MPSLLIINLLSVINERVIFIVFRTDSCIHVWMFMCRSNSCIFLWKDLNDIPNTDTIIDKIFAVIWCHIFVISRANGTCFSIFSCYFFITLSSIRVLISIRCVVSFILSISVISDLLFVIVWSVCVVLSQSSFYNTACGLCLPMYVCMHVPEYHFPLWTCNSVLWLCEFLSAGRLCLFIIIITIIVISI